MLAGFCFELLSARLSDHISLGFCLIPLPPSAHDGCSVSLPCCLLFLCPSGSLLPLLSSSSSFWVSITFSPTPLSHTHTHTHTHTGSPHPSPSGFLSSSFSWSLLPSHPPLFTHTHTHTRMHTHWISILLLLGLSHLLFLGLHLPLSLSLLLHMGSSSLSLGVCFLSLPHHFPSPPFSLLPGSLFPLFSGSSLSHLLLLCHFPSGMFS